MNMILNREVNKNNYLKATIPDQGLPYKSFKIHVLKLSFKNHVRGISRKIPILEPSILILFYLEKCVKDLQI